MSCPLRDCLFLPNERELGKISPRGPITLWLTIPGRYRLNLTFAYVLLSPGLQGLSLPLASG